MKCTIVVTILESILLFHIDRKFQSDAEYVNVLNIQRKQVHIQWLHFICCISSIYKIEPYIIRLKYFETFYIILIRCEGNKNILGDEIHS